MARPIDALTGFLIVVLLTACTPGTPPTPTPVPVAEATPVPADTSVAGAMLPTLAPSPATDGTPAPAVVYVGNTDGEGVYLRRTPTMDDRIRAYPDGTVLTIAGAGQESEGQAWLFVRAPDGTEGWVPQRYTTERPQ